ncbi:hypothetical protein GCM10009662_40230 [Catellatospora coxensis]|uniref:Uncharacterized protein n=1 Tax=Catellatospora coxensis TaxID=310354 RepID=A0A8J3P9D8_9ACTN|nr:hypothetical protein Cco03nite_33560 [Catellatospora coxensis]
MTELAEAVLPDDRLGPPAACATAAHAAVAIMAVATAVATALIGVLVLITVLCHGGTVPRMDGSPRALR